MGKPIHYPMRQQIVQLRQTGLTISQIAEQIGLSYWTVRRLLRRLRDRGESGLAADYSCCGQRSKIRSNALTKRAACWLRRIHPEWGAPLIHLKLVQRYGSEQVASIRQLQRWFRQQGLSRPRSKTKDQQDAPSKAKQVHQCWQVDAKERLRLANGQACSYLSIVDEHSGAGLAAVLFSILPHFTSTCLRCI